jgi:hypothetical protein
LAFLRLGGSILLRGSVALRAHCFLYFPAFFPAPGKTVRTPDSRYFADKRFTRRHGGELLNKKSVIPAQAGTHFHAGEDGAPTLVQTSKRLQALGPRFRGDDNFILGEITFASPRENNSATGSPTMKSRY